MSTVTIQIGDMDKLRSLHDAIARDVEGGMTIAMGGALESLIPFAPRVPAPPRPSANRKIETARPSLRRCG
jgi:hypothetical protein